MDRAAQLRGHLARRTEHGFTGTFEAMLTRPFVIHYYDTAYSAKASRHARAFRLSAR
jgi:hypothetical protein